MEEEGFCPIADVGHILNIALISSSLVSAYAAINACRNIDFVGSTNPILTTSSAVRYQSEVSPGRR